MELLEKELFKLLKSSLNKKRKGKVSKMKKKWQPPASFYLN